jgi:pimeloyl-ACP methyl ester carboxylesterase
MSSLVHESQSVGETINMEVLNFAGLRVMHVRPSVVKLNYPVVFQPGFWSTGEMFERLMVDLARFGIESYAVTSRGKPGSSWVNDPGKTSIDDYIRDLRLVLNILNRPVILVGHSAGVIISSQVALHDTHYVMAYAAMTSAPPKFIGMGWRSTVAAFKYLWPILWGKLVQLKHKDARRLLFNALSDEDGQRLCYDLVPESGRAIREIILMKYRMPRLEDIPLLWIAAGLDRITPHQSWASKMLGVRKEDYVVLPHAGHMLMHGGSAYDTAEVIRLWIERSFSVRLGQI